MTLFYHYYFSNSKKNDSLEWVVGPDLLYLERSLFLVSYCYLFDKSSLILVYQNYYFALLFQNVFDTSLVQRNHFINTH